MAVSLLVAVIIVRLECGSESTRGSDNSAIRMWQ